MPSSHLSPLQKRRSAPDLRGGTDGQHVGCPFHPGAANLVSSPSALRRTSSALGLRRLFVDTDGRAKLIEAPDATRTGDARYAFQLAHTGIPKQPDERTSVQSTREVSDWLEALPLTSEFSPVPPSGPDSPNVPGEPLDDLPHAIPSGNPAHTHDVSFAERLSSNHLPGPAFSANAPRRTFSAAFFPLKTSAPVPALLAAFEWSRSVPPVPAEWDSDSDREKDAGAANDAAGDCDEPFTVSEHDSDTDSAFKLRALNAEIDYLKQLVSDEIMEQAGVASERPSILDEVVAASDDEVRSSDNEGGHSRHESHLPAESDDAQPDQVDDALASSNNSESGMCRGV
ncbi:uncharacterized protein SCHCODRAFT_01156990 [Schizophyllum commune H4-8]|uniref:Expressed protein n=1 Tax=Schizophyllum commune (strain H4-8 / FGSC 9210) TaxID=578458 RepID=D8QAZ4_SCHCM|nr:uncharacterized protein SCHCODRAFT_01156990 [Schizophyllum commune H4-8]KAI5888972.1 hypothetical protein SCHCODRAFT_01156990 [Schizophyllum commune H4-8]